jgi:transposase
MGSPRIGKPRILSGQDLACIKEWLREEERTYNAQQLVEKLREERKVEISATRLRRMLTEAGIHWKRTRIPNSEFRIHPNSKPRTQQCLSFSTAKP